jgi:hypothetical protein
MPDTRSYAGRMELVRSYSAPSDLNLGTAALGDLESQFTRVGYGGTFNPGADVSWGVGLEYARWDFSRPAGAPLPANLGAVTMPLSARWKIDEHWLAFGELSPGIYSDFVDLRSEDFNAPFIGGVGYSFSRDLQVFFTVSLDGRRDVPVVGGPGVLIGLVGEQKHLVRGEPLRGGRLDHGRGGSDRLERDRACFGVPERLPPPLGFAALLRSVAAVARPALDGVGAPLLSGMVP